MNKTTMNKSNNEILNYNKTLNNNTQKYINNERYCENNTDCVARVDCCNSCLRNYVNKYHKKVIPRNKCNKICTMECPRNVANESICVNNTCVPK